MVLDLEAGRVAYLAIESGGFLGIGENLYAVPMGAVVDVDVPDEAIRMRLTEERLEAMRSFEAEACPWAEPEIGWGAYAWAGEWELGAE